MRTFEKSDMVVERKVRNAHILVPLQGTGTAVIDCLYTLNETAGLIWDRAVAGVSDHAIAVELSATCEVDSTTAEADVQKVLNDLIRIGALRLKTKLP